MSRRNDRPQIEQLCSPKQTKKALWELENICRTLYILDFIDDVVLRQSVQRLSIAVKRITGFDGPSPT